MRVDRADGARREGQAVSEREQLGQRGLERALQQPLGPAAGSAPQGALVDVDVQARRLRRRRAPPAFTSLPKAPPCSNLSKFVPEPMDLLLSCVRG